MPPRVVIGIPNWNGKDLLADCLESLARTTTYENYSTIVIDNGSTDGSVDMVKTQYPDVELIENPTNLGVPKAINQVFQSKLPEDVGYFVFLNNDLALSDNWLTKLIDVAQREDVGIVGCKNRTPDGNIDHDGAFVPLSYHSAFPINLSQHYAHNKFELDNPSTEFDYIDLVQSSVIVISREVVDSIGQFDESYSPIYYDEYEYCLRAWNAGFKVAINHDVEISHQGQQSEFLDIERRYHLKRNELRFMLMHYPLSWLVLTLPGSLLPPDDFLSFFLHSSQGRRYGLKIMSDIIRELPAIAHKRTQRSNAKELLK